ncbi:hypothetical protein ACFQ88_24785 [Paenibacillus sp. NPDC056579]|uniref:hypothetical protein n=1 Tax=Paenibacillus sp. NPDC056579 TaxID=3345871 RepID=UPI0036BE2985
MSKIVTVKDEATDGERSDVGIVAKKLARKAAKASESARIADASSDPKGGDLCEA